MARGRDWLPRYALRRGYPAWFRFIVGAAEVAGAIGLLVPRLRFYAAAGLVGVMLGAIGTHIVNGEAVAAPIPLVLAALVGVVAWFSRPAWVQQRSCATSSCSSPSPAGG